MLIMCNVEVNCKLKLRASTDNKEKSMLSKMGISSFIDSMWEKENDLRLVYNYNSINERDLFVSILFIKVSAVNNKKV